MHKPLLNDKHCYIIAGLFIVCAVFYYFGELVNICGWDALRWEIFSGVHDPHRMLFLVPILYSSYYFRLRGAVLANIFALIIFLPRTFFISSYPDAILRMAIFMIVAIVISMLTALIFNERDRLHTSIDTLKQSEEKNRAILEQMYDSYYEVDIDGNFTLANNSVCQSLGYTREELIGKNYRLMVPEDSIKSLLLAFNEV